MNNLCRVAWRAKTGARGAGTGEYPYDEAKRYADYLNEKDKDIELHHWPELVPDDEQILDKAQSQTT